MKYVKAVIAYLLLLLSAPTYADSDIPPLEADEGYAVIAIYSKGYSENIVLEGSGLMNSHKFGPLNYEQHIEVMKLPAGTYTWSEIYERTGSVAQGNILKIYYDITDQDLSFTVQAGKLNYVGLLMIDKMGMTMRTRLLNRTSIILKILEQDHSPYLEQYPLVNGIYPNDHYIGFYQSHAKKEGAE